MSSYDSPNEKYLVSYSSKEPTNPRDSVTVLFNIFDSRSARKLRMFEGTADEYGTSGAGA